MSPRIIGTQQHREAWLKKAAAMLNVHLFQPAGYTVPANLRVACGFPYGRRGGKGQHAIGQCWAAECSDDGTFEIFVSPEIDDRSRAVDVLLHEMVHAVVGLRAQHGPLFRRCAVAMGLTGKMTETVASPELAANLARWLANFPPYPHRKLNPAERSGPKKEGTRMLKLTCPACGYTVRTTAKWIEVGLPICPCGEQFQSV